MPLNDRLMDPINLRILTELQNECRVSLAELARRLQVSAPTIAERLGRLESAGMIRGYHAESTRRRRAFR